MATTESFTLSELESRIARLAFYYFQLDTLHAQLRDAIFEGDHPKDLHTTMLNQYGDLCRRTKQSYDELRRLTEMLPNVGAPINENAEARRQEH